MPIFLPFRSLMVRMGSCANSSKHPECMPANAVTGMPRIQMETITCAQLLWLRRKAEERVDLAVDEQLHRLRLMGS